MRRIPESMRAKLRKQEAKRSSSCLPLRVQEGGAETGIKGGRKLEEERFLKESWQDQENDAPDERNE